jgi:hypothetical protein
MITYPRYRAWDKEYSHMYANAYPFEHLVYVEMDPNDPEVEPYKDRMMQVNGKWFYWILAKDIELMEYLPFRDKSGSLAIPGKQICEGDIVAFKVREDYTRFVVRLGHTRTEGSDHCSPEEYYGVYLDDEGYSMPLENETVYILGNIYEHPELLNKEEREQS